MQFLSLFSGIGGFDRALERAGMLCIGQVEKDKHCRRVLAKYWPNVIRESDVKNVESEDYDADLLCAGWPCQDLSVAGDRAGLAGRQSGLFGEITRLLAEKPVQWLLLENVLGLLSSRRGRDMATVIGSLAELGYGVCWRVLDAQYFELAQRRKRLFLVGCLGSVRRAAEVLFEPESLQGYSPTSREAREKVTPDVGGSLEERMLSHCVTSREGLIHDVHKTTLIPYNIIGLGQQGSNHAYPAKISGCLQHKGLSASGNEAGTLVASRSAVRRLLPIECARLQGFPDTWLDLDPPLADTVKYRLLGNSVAVPVVHWIAKRIMKVQHGSL